jgi:nitrite reductase/ring-hydroxylating ferredoxin subunit
MHDADWRFPNSLACRVENGLRIRHDFDRLCLAHLRQWKSRTTRAATPWIAIAMEGFEEVAKTSELPEGAVKAVKVSGTEVMVANIEGKMYAIGNKCTHVGGPLAQGKLAGSVIECPWHGSKFDVKTGAVVAGPALQPEPTFQVKVENSAVWIKKP